MYHHRVDYPGFDFGRPKSDLRERKPETRSASEPPDVREHKVARRS